MERASPMSTQRSDLQGAASRKRVSPTSSRREDVPAAPEKTKTGATIQMLTVKPNEDLSDVQANWLSDAPVDLIVGEALSGTFGVGGNWIIPAYAATAGETTSFATVRAREVGR